MKKILIVLCVAILCVTLLAACGELDSPNANTTTEETVTTTAPEETTTEKAGATTRRNETTTTAAPSGEWITNPPGGLVDDRPNGNGAKPDNFVN